MNELASRTRNTIIILGLIQGLVLLAAHIAVVRGFLNTSDDLVWIMPWWAAGIGVFIALQLTVSDVRDPRVWRFAPILLVALIGTAAYAGYTVEPSLRGNLTPAVFSYIVTAFIGWYVLLPFVQASLKIGRWRPDYPTLFEFAWNNGITLLIAAIFTGIFWSLLGLWAGLFNVIGISWFAAIFYNKYFAYPVTALVFAFAIYLGRSHVGAVVTVRRVVLAVYKGLLPLLAVIALLFLAALPFMGLKPLWATGKATALMLTLQILSLFFLNAVFQNGQGERPYNAAVRAIVRAAVVLLPIYTILCAYALYLRVDQYGWSTDRFWAALLTFVVGLHVVGYAAAALRRSAIWMGGMAPANVAIAAVVVALSVAVNSPLLDAQRISATSQVARLLEGKVSPADFDYRYLRFDLGRAGNTALARLQDVQAHPGAAAIRASAAQALKQADRYSVQAEKAEKAETAEQAAGHFALYPRGEQLSGVFLRYVMAANWRIEECIEIDRRCAVLAIDLNGDKRKEYVVFSISKIGEQREHTAHVYTPVKDGWRLAGNFNFHLPQHPQTLEALEAVLANADYGVVDNPWQNLRIGKHTEPFRPE